MKRRQLLALIGLGAPAAALAGVVGMAQARPSVPTWLDPAAAARMTDRELRWHTANPMTLEIASADYSEGWMASARRELELSGIGIHGNVVMTRDTATEEKIYEMWDANWKLFQAFRKVDA